MMQRLQRYNQTKKMAWMVLVFVLTVPQMVLAGHPIVTQDTISICEPNGYSFNYQSLTDKQNFNR